MLPPLAGNIGLIITLEKIRYYGVIVTHKCEYFGYFLPLSDEEFLFRRFDNGEIGLVVAGSFEIVHVDGVEHETAETSLVCEFTLSTEAIR